MFENWTDAKTAYQDRLKEAEEIRKVRDYQRKQNQKNNLPRAILDILGL